MDETNKQYNISTSFYDKYIQEDENMQAKIKPVLNQIQENRVAVKELHIQYGVRFSEIMNSYQNRLEDLKDGHDTKISLLQLQVDSILDDCNKLLTDINSKKP